MSTDATNELKTSVSDGKTAIAAAVTDKGVNTAASDSFSTMAGNIRSISSGGKVYLPVSYNSWGRISGTTEFNKHFTLDMSTARDQYFYNYSQGVDMAKGYRFIFPDLDNIYKLQPTGNAFYVIPGSIDYLSDYSSGIGKVTRSGWKNNKVNINDGWIYSTTTTGNANGICDDNDIDDKRAFKTVMNQYYIDNDSILHVSFNIIFKSMGASSSNNSILVIFVELE